MKPPAVRGNTQAVESAKSFANSPMTVPNMAPIAVENCASMACRWGPWSEDSGRNLLTD